MSNTIDSLKMGEATMDNTRDSWIRCRRPPSVIVTTVKLLFRCLCSAAFLQPGISFHLP